MPKPRSTSAPNNAPTQEQASGSQKQASESLYKAVTSAINNMDVASMRTYLKLVCERYPPIRCMVEKEFTVQGKDVMPYHRDVESENDEDSDLSTEYETDCDSVDSEGNELEPAKKLYPIAVEDEEYTSRFAVCRRCQKRFDVTENNLRECSIHKGEKIANPRAEVWEGSYKGHVEFFMDALHNNPEYAKGFKWSCCGQDGNGEGCKSMKHKAAVNLIVKDTGVSAGLANKREAEDDLDLPKAKK